MSLIGGVIKEALYFKLKNRNDGVTDQFSRIFMSKMFIISATVMTIDFFTDRVACIIELDVDSSIEFMRRSCWISGFYVYDNLPYNLSIRTPYYGMPEKSKFDGITKGDGFCNTKRNSNECEPLKRTYFDQYQYFSFYIASLAVVFYLPYIFFKAFNSDMKALKDAVKNHENVKAKEEERKMKTSTKGNIDVNNNSGNSNKKDDLFSSLKKVEKEKITMSVKEHAEEIADHYFDNEENSGIGLLRLKTFANLVLKAIYVAINFSGFLFTDHLLNNKFINYGVKWVRWALLPNYLAHDNQHLRGFPKPGNELLPTMGFCDLTPRFESRTSSEFDDHRCVCEISTHILYQYVLLVLWFIFVAGILMSSVGFILHLLDIATIFVKCSLPKAEVNQKFGFELFVYDQMYRECRKFTIREIEYMRYIRKHNYELYRIIQPECDRLTHV